jgi:hypothetical protein
VTGSPPGYLTGMTEDRRTKPGVTPGEDPREIDREKTSEQALDEVAGQEGIVRPEPPRGDMGTSTGGRDLGDLEDAPEPRHLRDEA